MRAVLIGGGLSANWSLFTRESWNTQKVSGNRIESGCVL